MAKADSDMVKVHLVARQYKPLAADRFVEQEVLFTLDEDDVLTIGVQGEPPTLVMDLGAVRERIEQLAVRRDRAVNRAIRRETGIEVPM